MSQRLQCLKWGRMCFVPAGVIMGKLKKPNGGNPCIGAALHDPVTYRRNDG